jgi:hypothetical protein
VRVHTKVECKSIRAESFSIEDILFAMGICDGPDLHKLDTELSLRILGSTM